MQVTYQTLLHHALTALKQNQFRLAASHFDKLHPILTNNPQLYKPAIIAYLKSGNEDGARNLLPGHLKFNPKDADLHNIYADLAKRTDDFKTSEKHFLLAISLAKNIPAFKYNLALLYFQQHKFSLARPLLLENIGSHSDHQASILLYLKVLFELKSIDEAVEHLEFIKQRAPDLCGNAQYIKYLILVKIEQQDYEHAQRQIASLTASNASAQDFEDICLHFVCNCQGMFGLSSLEKGLNLYPTALELLNLYTSLSYELQSSDPLKYWNKLTSGQWTLPLVLSFSRQLKLLGEPQQALSKLESHLSQFSAEPEFWYLWAELNTTLGNYEKVIELAQNKPSIQGNQNFQELIIKSYLGLNENSQALNVCTKILNKFPEDQYLRALYATCLRANEHPLYNDFYDYKNLVTKSSIEVPNGFANISEFNEKVKQSLQSIHIMKASPLSQSVTGGGTQTPGFLFNNDSDILAILKRTLETTWARLIKDIDFSKLANDNPLHQGLKGELEWKTAWSITNRAGGFHLPHIHSKGLFSGVYYVDVPAQGDNNVVQPDSGCIGFGKPDLPVNQNYDFKIRPTAGEMVIFPSFFWHGTLPFAEEGDRIVVAFDLNYCN
ncbi:putative 2OG-Fe(II) oxygenase [Thalassotalea litorea]|uniref:putative 2OG-Fe(II) oxygenase n=1 Tax=Thalassotalea litorea TaxID=2020715 RepID=UPI003735B41E